MDIKENRLYSPSSAGMLDGARDVRIGGAKLNNVAGDFSMHSSSNTFIYIRQESGILLFISFVTYYEDAMAMLHCHFVSFLWSCIL